MIAPEQALAEALEQVAAAMDAETAAVRSGERESLAEAAERKRLAIEAAETMLARIERAGLVQSRVRLEQAARRMQAAAERNAVTLQGALDGARRLFACLGEAARQASSTGTYGPDGRHQRSAETLGTIHRSA